MPALGRRRQLALVQRRGEVQRELVLHAHDVDDAERHLELLDARVGDAHPAHLARVLELLEGADRLGVGHGRIGPVELVEVDHVGLERRQRRLARGADVLRAARRAPSPGPRGCGRLGGDDHAVARGRAAPWRSAARRGRRRARRARTHRRCRSGSRRRPAPRGSCGSPDPRRAGRRARAASRRARSGRPRRRRACVSSASFSPCLPEAHVFGRDVVAQPLVGRLAQRPGLGALVEVDARDQPRLDEARELRRLAPLERALRASRATRAARPAAAARPA